MPLPTRSGGLGHEVRNSPDARPSLKAGGKDIVVKKHEGEKFPRFISYSRDGDEYELTFSDFVKN